MAEETLDIYAPLAGRMGMQEMREELEDLSFRELYPDAYNVVTERLLNLALRNKDLTLDIEQQLMRKLADRGIAAKVKGRQKRAYSIWRKMERKSVGFEQLSDIFAFRVIVNARCRLLSGASASCTQPGRSCPAASRIISRRRSRTTIARSTPR